MNMTNDELNEFYIEARELLDSAEHHLLNINDGESYNSHYDAVFRALHNLKGASGFFELHRLQEHVHTLETEFTLNKGTGSISPESIDYFLRGCDHARKLIDNPVIPPFHFKAKLESPEPSLTLDQGQSKPRTPVAKVHFDDPLKAAVALIIRYYPEIDRNLIAAGKNEELKTLRYELQLLLDLIKKAS